jgi:hypothetical protein
MMPPAPPPRSGETWDCSAVETKMRNVTLDESVPTDESDYRRWKASFGEHPQHYTANHVVDVNAVLVESEQDCWTEASK